MRLKKSIFPSSLYGRFLLVIIASVVIVQVVSIYVFYYTHLDVISKHMARSVIEEMVFVKRSVNKPGYEKLLKDLSENTGIGFSFEERRRLKKKSKIADSSWKKSKIYDYINPLVDPYNRFKSELESHHLTPYEIYENPDNDDLIIVKIQARQGLISFDVPVKRITSSSAYVFTFWMTLTALITLLISIIFIKNQVRSIRNLSEAAEKFGRGQDVQDLKPSGSKEIRSLAVSFIKMKERVMRQIRQRTDMLSAVSHDLRTPLTRMKLQLEMIDKSNLKESIEDLKQDIHDMESLVNEYLDFARFDDKEKAHPIKIKKFLQEQVIAYYQKMSKTVESEIDIAEGMEIPLRKIAFKRALINLIDNGFNHGSKVALSALISSNNLTIMIDDNGPGIPKSERSNVFKPFYRIDNSRNLDKKSAESLDSNSSSAGSGLGLAITTNAITSHGGKIKLDESQMGGLRVLIHIPI